MCRPFASEFCSLLTFILPVIFDAALVTCIRRTLWGDCSSCRETFSSQWNCPAAVQVYNDLSGNTGSSAGIVETDGQDGEMCIYYSF